MKNTQKMTIMALALIGAMAVAAPIAQASTPDDVQADQIAIRKDNAALKKDQANLRRHRAAKAAAKANGDNGQQAVESTKIGAVQSTMAEKNAEKNVDVNNLQDDKENLGDR